MMRYFIGFDYYGMLSAVGWGSFEFIYVFERLHTMFWI